MTKIGELRAAGKLTVEDEAKLVRMDLAVLERANPAARKILAPVVAEQVAHYEAAKRAAR